MPNDACALSKPCLDIGFFTNRPDPMLAFWREELGLAYEDPVEFNDGLTQYRHALGPSVIKINTAADGVAEGVPSGFRELFVAEHGLAAPRTVEDPDGNPITFVPSGHLGITGLGMRLAVADIEAEAAFFTGAMGFSAREKNTFACGDTVLFLDHDPAAASAGHWVNAGLRYVTVHVMRIDDAFATMTAAGAAVGERPYSIGRIARISFVRDPHGNWFEVAQRASLAGPWWEED